VLDLVPAAFEHLAHGREGVEAQVRAVENALVDVVPAPAHYEIVHGPEVSDVRDGTDQRATLGEFGLQGLQQRLWINHVFEDVVAEHAIEVLVGKACDCRGSVGGEHAVEAFASFLRRAAVHLDAPDFEFITVGHSEGEGALATADVQDVPAVTGEVGEDFRAGVPEVLGFGQSGVP
jgi:hypothetical protein